MDVAEKELVACAGESVLCGGISQPGRGSGEGTGTDAEADVPVLGGAGGGGIVDEKARDGALRSVSSQRNTTGRKNGRSRGCNSDVVHVDPACCGGSERDGVVRGRGKARRGKKELLVLQRVGLRGEDLDGGVAAYAVRALSDEGWSAQDSGCTCSHVHDRGPSIRTRISRSLQGIVNRSTVSAGADAPEKVTLTLAPEVMAAWYVD